MVRFREGDLKALRDVIVVSADFVFIIGARGGINIVVVVVVTGILSGRLAWRATWGS